MLIVRMETPIYCVLHIVAYGPPSGRPAGEASAYWCGVAKKVHAVKRGGEKLVFTTDADAHLHGTSPAEVAHAVHFRRALANLQTKSERARSAHADFLDLAGTSVQDDYLGTCQGVSSDASSLQVPTFAHLVDAGYHEPLLMHISIQPSKHQVFASRRTLKYDKRKLKDPDTIHRIQVALSEVVLPSISIEQCSIAFMMDEAMRSILASEAPRDIKVPRQ